jgi:hypothetical protein
MADPNAADPWKNFFEELLHDPGAELGDESAAEQLSSPAAA